MPHPVTIVPHLEFASLTDAVVARGAGRAPSLVPEPMVVPSLPFGDQLQLRISDRRGVCMGIEFLMPEAFIRRAIGGGREEWTARSLTWRIFPHVRRFAGVLGVVDPAPRDAFALAGMLADRFDQYGHFRPEIFRRWDAGDSALPPGASEAERAAETWQRELWDRLCGEDGVPAHPAVELARRAANADFRAELKAKYPRLLVVGTGSVDPLMVEVLELLAGAGCAVELHVVLPSLEFLGDLWRRRELPSPESDPEELNFPVAHPLLESMGRHAVGSFLLLGRLDEQYTHWPESGDRSADAECGLLTTLREDIRGLREPSELPPDADDLSVRVHSCFGPRRELEALRDELARAFRDFPDLRPEEVQIVVTDLETYAPLVVAVLESGGSPLPIRMSELSRTGRDPVTEGLLAFLEMARERRFEASAVLEFFQLRAVQTALGAADDDRALESLRRWVRDSGVTRGLGGAEPGSWTFARHRLIAGRWFGREDEVTYPGGEFVLPISDQLGGDSRLREAFLGWWSDLADTLAEWEGAAAPGDWADRLERAALQLLGGENEALLALQPLLVFLRQVAAVERVDAGTIGDWLEGESAEAGRRTQISGRIAVGRFKQLRNIPCRVLAMVGLRDGAFPGQNRTPAWDLLQASPRAWDRNPRVDDRQLFLDALLTPKDRLIITAPTRNVRSGRTEPFSACVDELLRVAAVMGRDGDSLVVSHRLAPFADGYFREDSELPQSFDRSSAEVATRLEADHRDVGVPFYDAVRRADGRADGGEVTVRQLVDFWKNPARAFVRAQGIAAAAPEADDVDLDRAPLSLDGLRSWSVKRAVVDRMTSPGGGGLALTEAALRADRGLPPGDLGSLAWAVNREVGEPLGERVRELTGATEGIEVTLDDGVRVSGQIRLTADGGNFFAYRIGEFKAARHFLEPWIGAVVAAAGGRELPLAAIDEAGLETPKILGAIPRDEALGALRDLVDGYRAGQSRPLEYAPQASDQYAKVLAKKDVREAVDAAESAWKADSAYASGESHEAFAELAWRDRDAFEDRVEWERWGNAVAVPLRGWGGYS